MSEYDSLDLVIASLNNAFKIDIRQTSHYGNIIEEVEKRGLIEFIRNIEELDWERYIKEYQDVKESGVDPVEHFVNDGLYEGRQLFVKETVTPCMTTIQEDSYEINITIVIPNYNNSETIIRALKSVAFQTLPNIEVIIIDDCSIDDSVNIIEEFISNYENMKLLRHNENMSQHMAKKLGVAEACGKYIMFLDADDWYEPNACERCYYLMEELQGCDYIHFNTYLERSSLVLSSKMAYMERWLNNYDEGEKTSKEVLDNTFRKFSTDFMLWNKIFKSGICKRVFESLKDGFFSRDEDQYEFMAIVLNSSKCYRISEKLYHYTIRDNNNRIRGTEEDKLMNRIYIVPYIESYLRAFSQDGLYESVRKNLSSNIVKYGLNNLQKTSLGKFINNLINTFGILFVVKTICSIYFWDWDFVSSRLTHMLPSRSKYAYLGKNVKKIGILYTRFWGGGIETTIHLTCQALIEAGYEIAIFIEERDKRDVEIPAGIQVYYISPSIYNYPAVRQHLEDLYKYLRQSEIDLMLYMTYHSHLLLWDLMLLKLLGIPVIVSYRTDPNLGIMHRDRQYSQQNQIKVFRCADKLICLSPHSELFFRINGIDALCLPNTIKSHSDNPDICSRKNNIIVLCRMGDPIKRNYDALLILKEILRDIPDAFMYFVGGFKLEERKQDFITKAELLGVLPHIELTGWVKNPDIYLDKCKMLISTSYIEGFPNNIAEAQAHGLPCIIYDLPIMMAIDNPSIITIPQDDYLQAADKAVELLCDEKLLKNLSSIACEQSSKYSYERFKEGMVNLINNFDRESSLSFYPDAYYRRIINDIVFYSGRKIPTL